MIPEDLPTWTYWLLGFVALAAAAAWWIHVGDTVKRILVDPWRQADRLQSEEQILDRTRRRFREGADPTWQDDLNDSLRSGAGSFDEDDGPDLYLPGIESLPPDRRSPAGDTRRQPGGVRPRASPGTARGASPPSAR